MPLFPPGIFGVKATCASVYKNEKGTLVVAIHYEGTTPNGEGVEVPHSITGYHTLAKADGTLSEKTISDLRKVFGWDGLDPFWLADNDLSECPAQIDVESSPKLDGSAGAVSYTHLTLPTNREV